MKIKTIITGVTGMVGEGVLAACLNSDEVSEILLLSRKPYGLKHPKVKELIHENFFDLSSIENHLQNYNTCYFCLGVSSVGMTEPDYTKFSYSLTLHVAETLSRLNADMVFCYVSGAATDSTEKGKTMWARVKGKTENELLKLPFKKAYMFRPGYMQPTKGLKNTLPYYRYVSWMYPFLRRLFPSFVCSLSELGNAMIEVVKQEYSGSILEVKDIVRLAKRVHK